MSKQSEAKKIQNYNPKPTPAECSNCREFQKESTFTHEWFGKKYYRDKNLRCGIGGFAVKKRGTCTNHKFAKPDTAYK